MQSGAELSERDFFKENFSGQEIRELAAMSGTAQIFASRSPSLKQMGMAGKELSDDEMVGLMLQEPKLVRRPMMRVGGKLMVGGSAAAVAEAIAEAV